MDSAAQHHPGGSRDQNHPASHSAGLRVNSEQLHSSQSFSLMRAESLRMNQLFVLWESRANAERRLGGASHSLNNESQPLPAAHFLPQFSAPAENWVLSETKLPLNLFHQLHNASNPGSGGDGEGWGGKSLLNTIFIYIFNVKN